MTDKSLKQNDISAANAASSFSPQLSERMKRPDFQGDFTGMILTAAARDDVISFAGGLPNPVSFPIEGLRKAADQVLSENGAKALQYGNAMGYEPLRQYLAERYRRQGIPVSPEEILITSGSQQALQLIGAAFLDEGSPILLEDPSYLAALQLFHYYAPSIHTVCLTEDGADRTEFARIIKEEKPRFFYTVPNFQNPTGLTYSKQARLEIASILQGTDTLLIEDNPYGDLRFSGDTPVSFGSLLGPQCILLGSFSKTVSPGMRIGWLVCREKALLKRLLAYKQSCDIHSSLFCQMILYEYLSDHDLDQHITRITALYRQKAQWMISCMERFFPAGIHFTRPEGGMFLWATLPDGIAAVDLAEAALQRGVAIVAGDPFYEKRRKVSSFRLNYSNSSDAEIEQGIRILGDCIREFLPV